MVMSDERTLCAGAGQLNRGRQVASATIGRCVGTENPNEPERGGNPNGPERAEA
jgi:hypothetical protein